MMSSGKWSFDKEAAGWDQNPTRVKLARDVASAILEEKVLTPDMDVLDFGCGTGLLALQLSPLARSVTGMDSSRGMLDVFGGKIHEQHTANVTLQHVDLDRGDVLQGSYDLIVCSMTLHHVREPGILLHQFHRILSHRGHLCLADLDPEEGQFHGENETVFHHGFDRAVLQGILLDAGFAGIRDKTAASVAKPAPDGKMKSFSVFLMTGQKGKAEGQ
jgi:2-polyprenyl-3-methyl-5-hydroxy-6-metoxy-1,4-benzoquinol methylase